MSTPLKNLQKKEIQSSNTQWWKNYQYQPLSVLNNELNSDHVVILGAGPSLNYAQQMIENFCKNKALFLVPDILAKAFIKKYPTSRRIIFTLENRRHPYLQGISNEKIAVYCKANRQNIPKSSNSMYLFHFDFDKKFDKNSGESTQIVSPGTVTGAAFAWTIKTLYKEYIQNLEFIHVHTMGIDLSYPDSQMYGRLAQYPFINDYWKNRETLEWEKILVKTSHVIMKHGYLIRTCEEFLKTGKNLETMLNSVDSRLKLFDYSPLGIQHPLCAKWDAKINAE
ncbi:MAG: hypothetical protein ABUK01_02275 [Leptospirales bacterium]